jgi:hypothetical protein
MAPITGGCQVRLLLVTDDMRRPASLLAIFVAEDAAKFATFDP